LLHGSNFPDDLLAREVPDIVAQREAHSGDVAMDSIDRTTQILSYLFTFYMRDLPKHLEREPLQFPLLSDLL
jgi:hypothetical protein